MMAAANDTPTSSPALVEIACWVRSDFSKLDRKIFNKSLQKVVVKAEDVAKIYHVNRESPNAAELDVLYEVLREFGIIASHVPQDFHIHVANVMKFLEVGDKTVTKSHVSALIFSRM